MDKHYGTSWSKAIMLDRFAEFEDPVTCMFLDKSEYHVQYGLAMDALCDAMDRYSVIEYFFEETPVVQGRWVFKGDDRREEVYEILLEYGCTDAIGEIQAGETNMQKRVRVEKAKAIFTGNSTASHVVKRAIRSKEEMEQVMERYIKVCELLETDLSGKQRKKLLREQRGLHSQMETSL